MTVLARGSVWDRLSLAVFGISLVGMYTVSTLYHSVPWRPRQRARMQRLDHTMIHLLIAGTHTPIAWIVFDGWLRWATLAFQWGVVAIGVAQKSRSNMTGAASIALMMTQGWVSLAMLWPLAWLLPWTAIFLIALGGMLYSVGMVLMATGWPRLWPRVFSAHELFHVFVIGGSSVHFAVVMGYMARAGG